MIYPQGFRYFELDINIKYNHRKALEIIKMNISVRKPKLKIFIVSTNENEACVMGWKIKIARKMKLTTK